MRKNARLWGMLLLVLAVAFGINHFSASSKPSPPPTKPACATVPQGNQASRALHFVAFGDWGAGTPGQKAIAQQLAYQYACQPFKNALLLGDNIYPDGNVKKWGKAYFTDMYAPLLNHGVHFIVALGNHDIVGGYQADQINFFKMPGYYYRQQQGPVSFFVLNTNTFSTDTVQQKWLQQALKADSSPWKIVIGHHPIFSSGEHGDHAGLLKSLAPLLNQYKVTLYLAGHDHDYERFKPLHGVSYIVSGGGGAYLRNFEPPKSGSLIRIKIHHFLTFEITPTALVMKALDSNGHVIDQTQWLAPTLAQPQQNIL